MLHQNISQDINIIYIDRDINDIKTCIGNDKDEWYCVIDKELFDYVVFS